VKLLRSLWDWSWTVTLPVTTFFLFWTIETFEQWRAFTVDYDARPATIPLRDAGVDHFHHMLRQLTLPFSGNDLQRIPPALQLPSIQLFAKGTELAKLAQDLPYSGFQFIDGLLTYGDGPHEVKLRYRGDFVWHWGFPKKSLRIKTSANDLFAGLREFNLIAPKFPAQIDNYLSLKLARHLGLIAPRCELVNVFLNGRNQGLHEFTEQLDEGTLRRHDRMPGDLFAGDLIGKDRFAGLSNRVFDLPQQWSKVAENNHYALGSRASLDRLVAILNGPTTEATHAELSQLLDMDAFGRFGAFELLTQTTHYDEFHNWRLFWDPWRCKLEPVVWDPAGQAPGSADTIAHDLVPSRLQMWLCRNGDYLAARQQALQDYFGGGMAARFDADVQWAVAAAQAALACDPDIRPTDGAQVDAAMQALLDRQRRIARELRRVFLEPSGHVQWARIDDTTLRLLIDGRRPTTEVALRFARPLAGPLPCVLRYLHFGVAHEVDLAGAVSVRDATLCVQARLFAQLVPRFVAHPGQPLRQHTLAVGPATYELSFAGLPADNPLLEVTATRGGEVGPVEPVATLVMTDLDFVYRSNAPRPRRQAQVWRGAVAIATTTEVFDDVVIEAGACIALAAKASLLFRGRVTALGTPEQPIRFAPASEGQDPWGTVLLSGASGNGSVFRCCDVRGGSGYVVPLEECCSMFSIHGCKDVRIEHCTFAENHRFDDMIHAVYADVVFDHVTLDGARMDALDCDLSTVVIRNSAFVRSGNDGVDLMTTRALVHDCTFTDNGDKGISIGEASSLIALRNRFDGCNKAMEAKDGSIAHAANCEIKHCRKALNSYKKNWRYDSGGRITVHKSVVVDNEALPTADGWSHAELIDCQVNGEPVVEYDQEYVDGKPSTRMRNTARLIECDAGPTPRSAAVLPFPADLGALQGLAGELWKGVRADRRGVPDGH